LFLLFLLSALKCELIFDLAAAAGTGAALANAPTFDLADAAEAAGVTLATVPPFALAAEAPEGTAPTNELTFDLAAASAEAVRVSIELRFDLTAVAAGVPLTTSAPAFDLAAAAALAGETCVTKEPTFDLTAVAATSARAAFASNPDLLTPLAPCGACAIAEQMLPSPMTPTATRYESFCIAVSLSMPYQREQQNLPSTGELIVAI
jgi:hypothetical protein